MTLKHGVISLAKRKTRYKRTNQRQGSGHGLSWVGLFIVLALVAVFVGFVLGRYMIAALIFGDSLGSDNLWTGPDDGAGEDIASGDTDTSGGDSDETGNDPPPDDPGLEIIYLSVKPASCFTVQIGAFSAKDHAEGLKAEAREKGYHPWSRAEGGLVKVRVGLFGSREQAEIAAELLEAEGYPIYVLAISRADETGGQVPVPIATSRKAKLEEAVTWLEGFVLAQADYWGQYEIGVGSLPSGGDLKVWRRQLDEYREVAAGVVADAPSSDGARAVGDVFLQAEAYLSALESIESSGASASRAVTALEDILTLMKLYTSLVFWTN